MVERDQGPWVGRAIPRKEDERFLTGNGNYIADLRLPGSLHIAVLHSPHAHARITSVDTSALDGTPGVLGVLTGEDVRERTQPFVNLLDPPYDKLIDYCLAVDKVRYVGEPVVAVAAEDKYAARDALELVEVAYELLEPVLDGERAMEANAPLLHDTVPDNVPWHQVFDYGDADARFAEADLIVKERFMWHRFTSCPLETVGAAAQWNEATGELTIHSNTQRPGMNLPYIARALGMARERIRLIVPDIGGGFGIKTDVYLYQVLVGLMAMKTGRPVTYIEDRTEHLLWCAHGQDVIYDAEMAFKSDGSILALKLRGINDEGAQMRREPVGAANVVRQPCGPYNFRDLRLDIYAVLTNKCPVGPNRSYGKMQQSFILDRLVDIAARRLRMDPVEVRFKNYIQPEEQPYEQPSGSIYDGGDYPLALRTAMEILGYDEIRREQEAARATGKLFGVGFGYGMDSTAINTALVRFIGTKNRISGDSESAWVHMDETGHVEVAFGAIAQGHGYETTMAQVVADALGITPDDVRVKAGFDSYFNPWTPVSGTYASRFSVVGAGAVRGAAAKVRTKLISIAAHLLGADADAIELRDRMAIDRVSERSVPLTELATVAWRDMDAMPPDVEAGLFAHHMYRTPFAPPREDGTGNYAFTYPYSMGAAVVEVDSDTGKVDVKRFICVEDAGLTVNPLIVEGQVHGAIGHQMGGALYEKIVYDENGQLLTSTFKDYLVPTAADLPNFETASITTPSLSNESGQRGMGEGGGAGLIAVVAAVEDALAPMGITLTSSHLDPAELWQAMQEAQHGA